MSNLISMNIVISAEARQYLNVIKRKFGLPNLHSAVEKAIEIARGVLEEKQ